MIRLKDIGEVAGVSTRTVSRALKNEGRIAPEVKDRIQRIADELGYRPDPLAQALRTGRGTEVPVLLFQPDELLMKRVAGLEAELGIHGYTTRLLHLESEESEIARTVERLSRDRLAGLVIDGTFSRHFSEAGIKPLDDLGVPVVRLSSFSRDVVGSYIDRARGIADGVRYLHAQGHRKIGYLGLLHDPSRVDGYLQACRDEKLTPLFLPFEDRPDRFAAAREAVAGFLAMSPRPTAVQAHSDEIALGFMAGLHDHGVAIPGDVAVIGFDDRQAATWSWPPLTTVAQPSRQVGVATARVLIALMNDDEPPEGGWCQILRPQLVIREST
jgi:DNA-binding LacI/PurR family transcriptional regulator